MVTYIKIILLVSLISLISYISDAQVIITIAGNSPVGLNNGNSSGDNGPAINAGLNDPTAIAFDAAGNLYIADANSFKIRKISTSGIITTIAGGGTNNPGDNGPAILANLDHPNGVSIDAMGRVYEAEANNRIRMISTTGIISTVAGNGIGGFSGDNGPATAAQIGLPPSVTVDASGNIFIPDANNGRIRKVNISTGIISTIAGNGSYGYNGEGIPATSAMLGILLGVAIDGSSNLYLSESGTNRIRKVDHATSLISTVAGNGNPGFSGDNGPAINAQINGPYKICLDNSGNIYIPEILNQRVRKVDAITGIITTIAGNGTQGFSGDGGLAINAQLSNPMSVAVDASGNVYIADAYNNRIRKICISSTLPTVSISTNSTNSICSGTPVTFTASPGSAASPSYQWIKNGATVGTNSNTYIYTPADGDSIRCVITKNDACAGVLSASSNTINMTVTPSVVPTINITPNPSGAICAGTSVTYTAAINNGGTSPIYQWKANGTNTGANSNIFTYIPNNGDSIRCVLTSNATCASPAAVSSNTINMTVNPTVVPTLNITVSPNDTLCADSLATFTATATNAGSNPMYQWKKNGANAGSNSNTYTYQPANGDSVRCVLTSTAPCAAPAQVSSNSINMVINPNVIASLTIVGDTNVQTGVPTTYNAVTNVTGVTYQWQVDGVNVGTNSSTFIYTPATTDAVISCYITVPANSCAFPNFATTKVTVHIVTAGVSTIEKSSLYHVYPNPANDILHINNVRGGINYRLQNIVGICLQQGIFTQEKNMLQLQELPAGIYLLQLTNKEGQREVVRVVKE